MRATVPVLRSSACRAKKFQSLPEGATFSVQSQRDKRVRGSSARRWGRRDRCTELWAQILLGFHILGASVWVGGSIALGIVVYVLRSERVSDPGAYARRVGKVGRTLAWVLWPVLVATIVTGALNLLWYLPPGAGFFDSPGGVWLPIKVTTVGVVVVTNGLHTFVFSPRVRAAVERGESSAQVARWRSLSGAFAGISALASVLILFEAVMLGGM